MPPTPTSSNGDTKAPRSRATQKAPVETEAWVSKTAGLPVGARVDALRDALVDAIEQEVDQRNVRVILWLADKLKVLEAGLPTTRQPADELRSFFNELDNVELREFAGLASRQE